MQAPQKYKIAVWSRRSGKTKTVLNEQIRKALTKKGVYYYILPTYKMAKTIIWETLLKEHLPEEVILRKNEVSQTIFYKNGSIHRFIGCEDPDKHRGSNPIDVVFDEYSEIDEIMWTAIIQPVLRENKGTATFIYTPKGKNHSWKLLQIAKENPQEWFWSVKSCYDTTSFTDEDIENIKKNTPLALFQQEYEVAFLEGASQFFRGIRELCYDTRLQLPQEGQFNLGVDLAKYNDWTVLTPFNKNNGFVYPQDRFNNVDWVTQEARIEATARRWDAYLRVDSTGVGDPIVDTLKNKGLNMDDDSSFKFSEKSRWDILSHLAILIEGKKLKLPLDEGLIAELEAFRYELANVDATPGSQTKVKLTVPRGMTDDRVFSLALAVWKWKEPIIPDDDVEFKLYSSSYN